MTIVQPTGLFAEVAGHFKMVAIRPDGTRRPLAEFDNLITDTGLEQYGLVGSSLLTGCAVGTGTAVPAVSDTGLANQIAHTTNSGPGGTRATVVGPPAYSFVRLVFRFPTGAAAGNLTEVGIRGGSSSSGPLFSRARILDGSGNPTTITVLADEVLDVTYELRVYHVTTDVTGTVNLGGTNYDFTIRRANSNSDEWGYPDLGFTLTRGSALPSVFSGGIGAANTTPSGYLANATGVTAQAYTNGSRQRDFLITVGLSAVTSNIGALMLLTNLGIYQIGFSPVIPKTASNILTLMVRLGIARRV